MEAGDEKDRHELVYFEPRLTLETVPLARGFAAVCPFVNDQLSADVPALGIHQLPLRTGAARHAAALPHHGRLLALVFVR